MMNKQYLDEASPKWKATDLKDDVTNMLKIKLLGCNSLKDEQRKNKCKELVYNQCIQDLKRKSLICKSTKCYQSISSTILNYVNKIQQLYR